jgi:molybdenum cofactor cytidylyltransferase
LDANGRFVTGIVLAAGRSRRLGQPKQLLPLRGATLLDATLAVARGCGFDQLLVTLGAAADTVRAQVDLSGARTVENADFDAGCGSSLATAMGEVDAAAGGIVLMLGDQPDVSIASVHGLLDRVGNAAVGVCHYEDGLGHPFWFGREVFADLRWLHGDKAVWKLLHSGQFEVMEHPVPTPAPVDVDTWADYEALLAAESQTR